MPRGRPHAWCSGRPWRRGFPSTPGSAAARRLVPPLARRPAGSGAWGVRRPPQERGGLCAGPEPRPWAEGAKPQPLSPAGRGTHSLSSSTCISFCKCLVPGASKPSTPEARAASAAASAVTAEPPAGTPLWAACARRPRHEGRGTHLLALGALQTADAICPLCKHKGKGVSQSLPGFLGRKGSTLQIPRRVSAQRPQPRQAPSRSQSQRKGSVDSDHLLSPHPCEAPRASDSQVTSTDIPPSARNIRLSEIWGAGGM